MKVGVIGGGQLGKMLGIAGLAQGHTFSFLDPSPDACAGALGRLIQSEYDDVDALRELADGSDFVTYEFENVSSAAIANAWEGRDVLFPTVRSLEQTRDRLLERELLQKASVPVARYNAVSSTAEVEEAGAALGWPLVLKAVTGGYDGKGQYRVEDASALERITLDSWPLLAEERVDFSRELSIVGVRDRTGSCAFYPLTENHHFGGILRFSIAPARDVSPTMEQEARDHCQAVMTELGHVGVLTIEFFQVGDRLIANEVAPRVHNSGHWTIEGAHTSQFDNHLRAGMGMPLGSTEPRGCAVMINLIGNGPPADELLSHGHLHLYGKAPRPGRKLGHVTVHSEDRDEALALASRVVDVLYQRGVWEGPRPGAAPQGS